MCENLLEVLCLRRICRHQLIGMVSWHTVNGHVIDVLPSAHGVRGPCSLVLLCHLPFSVKPCTLYWGGDHSSRCGVLIKWQRVTPSPCFYLVLGFQWNAFVFGDFLETF